MTELIIETVLHLVLHVVKWTLIVIVGIPIFIFTSIYEAIARLFSPETVVANLTPSEGFSKDDVARDESSLSPTGRDN